MAPALVTGRTRKPVIKAFRGKKRATRKRFGSSLPQPAEGELQWVTGLLIPGGKEGVVGFARNGQTALRVKRGRSKRMESSETLKSAWKASFIWSWLVGS